MPPTLPIFSPSQWVGHSCPTRTAGATALSSRPLRPSCSSFILHPSSFKRSAGFTLLELILVMILICTALAISAPDLRGFSAGARMKNAAQQILALTNYARAQAASNGRTYRLVIDPTAYSLTAEQDDGQFVPETTSLGQSVPLPDGVQIQLTRDDNQPLNYVEFHPDGRTDPARIRLSSDSSQLYLLCPSPSERFHVASSAEAQR